MDNLKNLLFLVPIMIYYFFESIFAALFVNVVYKYTLFTLTDVYITYFQWVAIIWIIKVVFFDVFKLISGLSNIPPQKQENDNDNQYNQYS
jgi:hypothetical protein